MKGFSGKLVPLAAVVLIVLAAVLFSAGPAQASAYVTLMTQPLRSEDLVVDGVKVGYYPVYDGRADLMFSWSRYWPLYWPDYPNPKPATQGYKVSVWQNTTPLAAAPAWTELHIAHHRIDDANPTRFTFGAFVETEKLCETCPSVIVVQAEAIQTNPEGSAAPYTYVPVTVTNSSGVPAIMKSDTIVIKGYKRLNETKCDLPDNLKWMCAFIN